VDFAVELLLIRLNESKQIEKFRVALDFSCMYVGCIALPHPRFFVRPEPMKFLSFLKSTGMKAQRSKNPIESYPIESYKEIFEILQKRTDFFVALLYTVF
jgi:hypothetical protein